MIYLDCKGWNSMLLSLISVVAIRSLLCFCFVVFVLFLSLETGRNGAETSYISGWRGFSGNGSREPMNRVTIVVTAVTGIYSQFGVWIHLKYGKWDQLFLYHTVCKRMNDWMNNFFNVSIFLSSLPQCSLTGQLSASPGDRRSIRLSPWLPVSLRWYRRPIGSQIKSR